MIIKHLTGQYIKTHGSVLCSPRKQGACKRSALTGTTKLRFSRILSSVISTPNGTKFAVEVPSTHGRPHSKFEEDRASRSRNMSQQNIEKNSSYFSSSSSSFRTLCKNHYNSRMLNLIKLKFGTLIGGLKANISFK